MADTQTLSGSVFFDLVKGGAANLYSNRNEINDLNVFPIPDGDTGDNMYMTIRSGSEATEGNGSIGEVSSDVARGMLLGARGNSGVILSRIFSGIAEGFKGKETAGAEDVIIALKNGIKQAYEAVSEPVEGTILSVYRDAAEYTVRMITDSMTIERGLELFCEEAERSLERTPELLAVLKDAGVVDSGGAGLLCIANGMRLAIGGNIGDNQAETENGRKEKLDLSLFTEDSVLEFGYCTEFLLRLQRIKTDLDSFDIEDFTRKLNGIGESVVSFRDGSIVKVHIHTKKPAQVIEFAQKYGEFLTLKIENMTLQHSEKNERKRIKPRKKYGTVAVASGDGIKETFLSMGADKVIGGGQCNNPSASDFIEAFKEVNADTIFVFPGNSNIIMTAMQAGELFDESEIRVIPCRTLGEIYVALSMLDTSVGSVDEIVYAVTESIGEVTTGIVSKASRDTEMNGITVKNGDYIGYVGSNIIADDNDRETAVLRLAEKLGAGDHDILLLICGQDASDSESKRIYNELSLRYKRTEVIMMNGGQPIQDYIIVLE